MPLDENANSYFFDHTCPICGKNFIPAAYHLYKVKNKLVCSYTCMLKGERDGIPKPKKVKKHRKVGMFDLDGTFIRVFSNLEEAAREMKLDDGSISKCCRDVYHSSGGFIWKYIYEEDREENNGL